jgi:DNA-binding CsgD family transcriptional regulator
MQTPAHGRPDNDTHELVSMAFLAGWSGADEAHLPRFPEVICNWVRADFVRLSITSREPRWIRTYAHPPRPEQSQVEEAPKYTESSSYRFKRELNDELTLCITAYPGENGFTPRQVQVLEYAAAMTHAALQCLFVTQKDRNALGKPFSELSDREWLVCQTLSDAESEKEISARLGLSPFTLHMYVRNIYRKLGVNSRLGVVRKLCDAQGRCRLGLLDKIFRAGLEQIVPAGSQHHMMLTSTDYPARTDRDECVA